MAVVVGLGHPCGGGCRANILDGSGCRAMVSLWRWL